ncbi:MAG: hypothetical protein HDR79_10520 [Bacteroides sp.]|nr:hypothetical protein [Bacteroides sp.]
MERRIPIRRHLIAYVPDSNHKKRVLAKATGHRGAPATVARQRQYYHIKTVYQFIEANIVELALHRGEGATKPGHLLTLGFAIPRITKV